MSKCIFSFASECTGQESRQHRGWSGAGIQTCWKGMFSVTCPIFFTLLTFIEETCFAIKMGIHLFEPALPTMTFLIL